MADGAEVKCPVHGTHGNSSNGRCWYCVQSGTVPAEPVTVAPKNKVVHNYKKKEE